MRERSFILRLFTAEVKSQRLAWLGLIPRAFLAWSGKFLQQWPCMGLMESSEYVTVILKPRRLNEKRSHQWLRHRIHKIHKSCPSQCQHQCRRRNNLSWWHWGRQWTLTWTPQKKTCWPLYLLITQRHCYKLQTFHSHQSGQVRTRL